MLSRRDYIKFSRKLSSMLEDCYLDTKYPNENLKSFETAYGYKYEEIIMTHGASSLTEDNVYIFAKEKALQHKDELLEMCANLPKMKTVATDTAGTITFTDLLPEFKQEKNDFIYSCERADKFIGLLEINGIAYARGLVGSKEFKAAPIILSPRYKKQLNPDVFRNEASSDEEKYQRTKELISKYSDGMSEESINELAKETIQAENDLYEIFELQCHGYTEHDAIYAHFDNDLDKIAMYLQIRKMCKGIETAEK